MSHTAAATAALSLSRRAALGGLAAASFGAGASASTANRRTRMGVATDSTPSRRGIHTLDFLDLCAQWGMGGVQCPLLPLDAETARQVRGRLEANGLFLVVSVSINDTERFRQTATLAKEAGASVLRVPSGGRRYEDFQTLAQRQDHVAAVRQRLRQAIPIAEERKIAIGLENHKDFTADEQVALYQEYSSPYFGCCVDTGNNMALLEDPMEVMEKLAPWAVAAHLKDATLEAYPDGFLLGDIPLGDGMLDLPRILALLRQTSATLPIVLECIARNPLKIPCFQESYWATFPDAKAVALARMMRLVHANKPKRQLHLRDGISPQELRAIELDNIERSIAYARDILRLTTD
ncbi:MAG: sugar phosphate isomerase/epimerase [Bryobacterales bacterium]|jgi:sugar phosphate isomerase/epimerase|nr:sugar phosphate isomerase/epimerase [Bryobacterales bacterium]